MSLCQVPNIYIMCRDIYPGVDDNGSGVAALLETARLMSSLADTCSSDTTILFVAFDIQSGVRLAHILHTRPLNCLLNQ